MTGLAIRSCCSASNDALKPVSMRCVSVRCICDTGAIERGVGRLHTAQSSLAACWFVLFAVERALEGRNGQNRSTKPPTSALPHVANRWVSIYPVSAVATRLEHPQSSGSVVAMPESGQMPSRATAFCTHRAVYETARRRCGPLSVGSLWQTPHNPHSAGASAPCCSGGAFGGGGMSVRRATGACGGARATCGAAREAHGEADAALTHATRPDWRRASPPAHPRCCA